MRPASSITQCSPWNESFSDDQELPRIFRYPKFYSVIIEVFKGVNANIIVFWDVMACILYQNTRHHIQKTVLFITVFTENYYWAISSARYVNPVYDLTSCKICTDILWKFCMRSSLKRLLEFLEYKLKQRKNDSQLCKLFYFLTRHIYVQLGINTHYSNTVE
jgi:hypothetical protein